MKTIWKYELALQESLDTIPPSWVIQMPHDAHVLHLEAQHGTPCMWALVDDESTKVGRKFILTGTGKIADGCFADMHVGTFLQGAFVWHVFEVVA